MKKILFLLLPIPCFALQHVQHTPEGVKPPWFTGPLLTPSALTVPRGHYNIEPYIFYQKKYGIWDDHRKFQRTPKRQTWNPLIFLQAGITDRLDVWILPQYKHISQQGVSSSGFGDTFVGIDIQLVKESDWTPDVKFEFVELLPTGKYNHLDPKKLGTDSRGDGAYKTLLAFSVQKVKHFCGRHFLRSRFYFQTVIPSTVSVRGFNSYGGGFGTKGTVRPGAGFNFRMGFEYSLTQNWVLATDIVLRYAKKDRFIGTPGLDITGVPSGIGLGTFNQLSFTPSIEYNFSQNLGLIAGGWFSAWGRNAPAFYGFGIALNYYH